jgi:hypothetical protein
MRQTRNLLYRLRYRGFESLSLRHLFGVAAAFLLLAVPAIRAAETPEPARFRASTLKPPLTAEIEKQLGPLRFKGAVTVARTEGTFFGWSGLWVSPDGSRFAAVEGGDST